MLISQRNYDRVYLLYLFCTLYSKHRDFDLAKKTVKNKPLTWEGAEKLSDFCNMMVTTKKAKPQDFIPSEDDKSNQAIDNYLRLKETLKEIKGAIGTKEKNELYKAVKLFYRKKTFCYQMDSYYMFAVTGFLLYLRGEITYNTFVNYYAVEVSLFKRERTPVNLRKAIKISNYIFECINKSK
jgi:hypothetical protein